MKYILRDTYGQMALSGFLVCIVSGIFLAIPYDIAKPYESLRIMLIANPGGTFFRNLHYWSAHFFLVLTLLHTWDFLKDERSAKTKRAVWLRLIIGIPVTFYLMLSGFILKGDPESLQARNIIDALLSGIPLAGSLLSKSLIGPDNDFQLLYVHHIATATIFIVVITVEHARLIWPKNASFPRTTIIFVVMAVFFAAPLHDKSNPINKGPWYFIGLQEILHRMTHPAWILIIITGFLVIVYYIPFLKQPWDINARRFLLLSVIIYGVISCMAFLFRGENWTWNRKITMEQIPLHFKPVNFNAIDDSILTNLTSTNDKSEGCLACHLRMKGLSLSHNPEAIGCACCHSGDPMTLNKNRAHRGMIRIPGNLSDVKRSCGNAGCHPEITERIQHTLMTTMSGVVSVDRFVFNESNDPDVISHISDIGHSAADQHLRNLCANCHLGNMKTDYGPVTQESRGGGCNACHLNYSPESLESLQHLLNESETRVNPQYHPDLSIKIKNEHCFGCHSRSGRISTSYEGWNETQLKMENITDHKRYRLLEDGRVFEYAGADIHFEKGMDCIDCHNSYELMGDGIRHKHKEDQVTITCTDCHFSETPATMTFNETDKENRNILKLRYYTDDRRFLKNRKSGIAMINTYADNQNKSWLITKNSGDTMPLRPPKPVCNKGKAHNRLACGACHTSWAPQCIGCHNTYETATEGFDMLENRDVEGTWVEYTGRFLYGPPTLGVIDNNDTAATEKNIITTFVPGMNISIDLNGFKRSNESPGTIFRRLYAPISAHTTSAIGRSCKSCHNDPVALGYGRGTLRFEISGNKGQWEFIPFFAANEYDGLPEDAWTGFLKEPAEITSTRKTARSFRVEEQQHILTVGSCLTCHDENSSLIMKMLDNFDLSVNRRSPKCVLPEYK